MRATSLPSRLIRAFRSVCEAEACLALKLGHSARVCCARIRIVTWLGFALGFGLGFGLGLGLGLGLRLGLGLGLGFACRRSCFA